MQLCHDTSMVNVLKMVLKRESAKEVIVLNYADYARLCNLFIGRHYFISFYVCILEDAVMRRVFTVVLLFFCQFVVTNVSALSCMSISRLVTSPATAKSKSKSKSTLNGQVQVRVQVFFKKGKSKSKSKSKSSRKKRACKQFYPIPILFLLLLLSKTLYRTQKRTNP